MTCAIAAATPVATRARSPLNDTARANLAAVDRAQREGPWLLRTLAGRAQRPRAHVWVQDDVAETLLEEAPF